MKQPPKFANLSAITLEKGRLQKAIARQEQTLLLHMQQAKQTTIVELSPLRLFKTIIGHFFSWKSIEKNPISSFKLGYKIIGFLVKKIRSRK